MEEAINLTITIESDVGNDEEVRADALELVTELLGSSHVESAEMVRSNEAKRADKSGIAGFSLVVIRLLPAAAPGFIRVIDRWLGRPRPRQTMLILKVGADRTIRISGPQMTYENWAALDAAISEFSKPIETDERRGEAPTGAAVFRRIPRSRGSDRPTDPAGDDEATPIPSLDSPIPSGDHRLPPPEFYRHPEADQSEAEEELDDRIPPFDRLLEADESEAELAAPPSEARAPAPPVQPSGRVPVWGHRQVPADAVPCAPGRPRLSCRPLFSLTFADEVDSALAAVMPGRFAFNPPTRMRQGQVEHVTVGVVRSLDLHEQLRASLRGLGVPVFEDIRTSPLMKVELRGDKAFDIKGTSELEQPVSSAEVSIWEFQVRALRAGDHMLTVVVALVLPIPGHEDLCRSLPVLERSVHVQVAPVYVTGQFVRGNWQWIIGTSVAVSGGVAAWLKLAH